MRVSDKGLAFIAGHEGVVTRAYRDVASVWTVGVGHTASAGAPTPRAGLAITRAQAFEILARDVIRFERRVDAALGPVPQQAFDGAVSFDFNTGAIERASWVKAYRAGNMTAARLGLMKWAKAGGRTVRGLVRRREAEARLIFDGNYGSSGKDVLPSDQIMAYQRKLAALGFAVGTIDGIAGPKTRAAVLAYQRSHEDLVADGIVGPATLASLARDIAARKRVGQVAGAVLGSAAAGAAGGVAEGGDPLTWAVGLGLLVLILLGGIFAFRYRGELRRLIFRPKKGV